MSKYLTSVSNMLMNNSDLLIAPKSTVKDAQVSGVSRPKSALRVGA